MHPKISSIATLRTFSGDSPRAGVTLIELSIVLVIIALIAGTIVVGERMQTNARIMSIISDAERYRSVIKSFKQKYNYYPGDFPDATSIWGAMTSPAACDTSGNTSFGWSSTTPVSLTCDGRGNGVIGYQGGDPAVFTQATYDQREYREMFYMWQHLALAGYIEGQYSGYSTSTINDSDTITPDINVPGIDYKDTLGFKLQYWKDRNLAQDVTARYPVQGLIGHMMTWSQPNGTEVTLENLIDSKAAESIDIKVDDGLPFSGMIFAHGRDSGGSGADVDDCTTGTAYQVDDTYYCGQYWRNFLDEH